jgi:hypothetical protein
MPHASGSMRPFACTPGTKRTQISFVCERLCFRTSASFVLEMLFEDSAKFCCNPIRQFRAIELAQIFFLIDLRNKIPDCFN